MTQNSTQKTETPLWLLKRRFSPRVIKIRLNPRKNVARTASAQTVERLSATMMPTTYTGARSKSLSMIPVYTQSSDMENKTGKGRKGNGFRVKGPTAEKLQVF
jgi:hypothetical protein